MNELERLCAFLKLAYENLLVLHHQLVGHGWLSAHEWIATVEAFFRFRRRSACGKQQSVV